MDRLKRNPDVLNDYSSEYDDKKKRKRDAEDYTKEGKSKTNEAESGKMFRRMNRLMTMDAYSRHKEMINLYYLNHAGALDKFKRDTSKDKTDYDVLKDNHKFLWSAEDESKTTSSWEARMAKKYYDKLFKEYCIVDLSMYQKNKVGMRWRIEKEVLSGKGQFICGNKKCDIREDLTSWEVNFVYVEQKERKNALVKVRLCPNCSEHLNFGTKRNKYVKKKKSSKYSQSGDKEKERKEKDAETSQEKPSNDEDQQPSTSNAADDIWQKPIVVEADRTVDDDIDEFLDELFD